MSVPASGRRVCRAPAVSHLCREALRGTGQDTQPRALRGTRLTASSDEVNAGGPQGPLSAKARGRRGPAECREGDVASERGGGRGQGAGQRGRSTGRAGFSRGAVGATCGSRLSPGRQASWRRDVTPASQPTPEGAGGGGELVPAPGGVAVGLGRRLEAGGQGSPARPRPSSPTLCAATFWGGGVCDSLDCSTL